MNRNRSRFNSPFVTWNSQVSLHVILCKQIYYTYTCLSVPQSNPTDYDLFMKLINGMIRSSENFSNVAKITQIQAYTIHISICQKETDIICICLCLPFKQRILKIQRPMPSEWLSWSKHCHVYHKRLSSIPAQGIYVGCSFDSQLGCIQEAIHQCFSLRLISLSIFSSQFLSNSQ